MSVADCDIIYQACVSSNGGEPAAISGSREARVMSETQFTVGSCKITVKSWDYSRDFYFQ